MEHITSDRNDPDLHKEEPSGMNKKYLVLSEAERAKGFVRPLRHSYVHVGVGGTEAKRTGKGCGVETRMGEELSATYARDPKFYGATFCVGSKCHTHLPVNEFIWNDGEVVGS